MSILLSKITDNFSEKFHQQDVMSVETSVKK